MTDIAAWRTPQPAILLRLERQQGKHMIDIGAHRARPAGPPRPNRGRNVVDNRNRGIAGPNPPCHPMGKIGAVDDHENVGRGFRHGSGGFPDTPQDHGELLHDRPQSHNRQLFDRKQRRQSFARHRLSADAFKPHRAAEALAQHLHQVGAKPIPRFLGRDQEYFSRDVGGCSRLHPAGNPDPKRPAPPAASLMAWGWTTIVLRETIAIPASRAAASPSMVCGPIVGRSKRKSWPLFGAFTSTPRAALARMRPSLRKRATRASNPSVPSMSSTPTT